MATRERQGTDNGAVIGTVPLQIGFDEPAAVRDAVATMGRIEDVLLAPSGRRLAFACFANEGIAVADIEITASASGPEIAVTTGRSR